MMLIFVLVMVFLRPSFSWLTEEQHEWNECHEHTCPEQFNCKCRGNEHTGIQECIDLRWLCDGIPDCKDEEDEIDCICFDDQFQCNKCKRGEECADEIPYYECIDETLVGNGWQDVDNGTLVTDCFNGNDEPHKCWPCNGEIECPTLTLNDEANCTECPSDKPDRCDCNWVGNFTCEIDPSIGGRRTCYNQKLKCDGEIDCTDGSDERGCNQCGEGEIECDCIKEGKCEKHLGCINKTVVRKSGFIHCPNERRTPFDSHGKINIYKLNNISGCNKIGFPQCDNSTCYTFNYSKKIEHELVPYSYFLCTSFCSDQPYCRKETAFQCSDKRYIFFDQFCDGIVDCINGSDEIVNKPGFKCNECVLPQNNLYDNLAQCDDQSDLCLFANNASCFQCLDKRLLISSKQVCDGVNDCYDLSDECLCEDNVDAEICVNLFEAKNYTCSEHKALNYKHSQLKIDIRNIQYGTKTITCRTKFGFTQALPCDGRPECSDYSDECKCSNPPTFCNDSCHSFFPMGDRYCDGVEDPAWLYINDSSCPKGFDERSCPKRFKCNAVGNVSIDVLQVCDGKIDCDDHTDEKNCIVKNDKTIFSSDTEMIANPVFKSAFWIVGFIVLMGNAYVIVNTAIFFKKQKASSFVGIQRIIILNISIADFIMGVYLIIIAAFSAHFSGIYGFVDQEWRSSLKCSIIGSLSVISSETSCFSMVVLTVFRLINVCNPTKSPSLLPWIISLAATWVLSILFGTIPMADATSSYFVHSISFSSMFHQNGSIDAAKFEQFMCRYAVLSNTTIKEYGSQLESIEMFLKTNLPESAPLRRFGYYGETSVCMPRFYVARGEPSWEYTVILITINFLSFIFIATSYVMIFQHSFNSSARQMRRGKADKQASKIQKRIARIIVTDFCCWIPICIMAYVRLGVEFSNVVYQISAAFLLPINSALNPFLFSSLPDKLVDLCDSKLMRRNQNSQTQMNSLKTLSDSASIATVTK